MREGGTEMGRNAEKDKEWRRQNQKQCHFYLNRVTDKDVLEYLEKQPNRREYLIALIRKDMKEG